MDFLAKEGSHCEERNGHVVWDHGVGPQEVPD